MNSLIGHTVVVFMGFFAIMNPIANVPIFLSLTADENRQTTKRIAARALLLAFFITTLFSVVGKIIFNLFGITLPAFQIAGGFLVSLIGFHMLQGNQSNIHQPLKTEMQDKEEVALSVAVSPLAMPILAGPGTITTAMNFSAQGGILQVVITVAAFAILCAITYLFFVFGKKFVTLIGVGALGVITRLMGLILAVIGVQMVIEGIQGAFKFSGG